MTSAISGEVLPATAQPPTRSDQPLDPQVERLVAEWLLGYGSANTRAAPAAPPGWRSPPVAAGGARW